MIRALERSIQAARRDALIFSVLTIVVTPVLIALSALGFLFFVSTGHGHGFHRSPSWLDLAHGDVATAATVLVALVAAVSLFDRRGNFSPNPLDVGGSVGAVLGLVALSSSEMARGWPFWGLFTLLGITALGFAGRAYVPNDEYYSRWCHGLCRSHLFSTCTADIQASFLIAIPSFVVDSYAAILGSVFLLRPVSRRELAAATGILQAIAADDPSLLVERIHDAGPIGPRALRLLHRLELVAPGKTRAHLTGRGRELVKACYPKTRLI